MSPLVNIGVLAARAGGDAIVRSMNKLHNIKVENKGRNDFVTEVDRFAEQKIIETIRGVFPQHSILAEESGASVGRDPDVEWIIDPIDGTTNFIHGFPVFCVSIAARKAGKLEAAVIYDPLRQELFTASRGNGAVLDNRKIRVTTPTSLEGCLIATGFPYREGGVDIDDYLGMMKAVSLKAAGVRRAGSAALDLAYVAAGRFDGFWELGLKIWDIAAGELLIREAGGLISDVHGDANHLSSGHVVAGSSKVFRDLLKTIAPHTKNISTK